MIDPAADRLLAFFTTGRGALAAATLTDDVFVGVAPDRIVGLLEGATAMAASLPADVRRRLGVSLAGWVRRDDPGVRVRDDPAATGEGGPAAGGRWADALARFYRATPAHDPARGELLAALAESDAPAAEEALLTLLAEAPPADPRYLVQGLSPLVRRKSPTAARLLPRLLEEGPEPVVLTIALDLANWLTREGVLASHPAAGQADRIGALLTEVAGRLATIERRPAAGGDSPEEVRAAVETGVTLAVGLCDAIGLIGEEAQAGRLIRALELSHRRVRTEAAAALARLGDGRGRAALLELAAEPVARLRVLQYARELDLFDQIDPAYRTEEAEAVGRVATSLAEPSRFGFAPTETALLASRRLVWPGQAGPSRCDLVRFAYRLPGGTYENIAFVGPEVDAVASDLTTLAVDDVFALFAGRAADDPEVRAIPWDETPPAWQEDYEPLIEELAPRGFEDVRPVLAGRAFARRVLIAVATWRAGSGLVVVAETDSGVAVLPHLLGRGRNALTPENLFHLHVGRALLPPGESDEGAGPDEGRGSGPTGERGRAPR